MAPQISVSKKFQLCADPVSIGAVTILQGTWHNDHVDHPSATPLRCITDSDVSPFQVKINSLPQGYTVSAQPQGVNFTSTATIAGNTVTFTLPVNVRDLEQWTVNVHIPGNPNPHQIWVKLVRHAPP